MITVHGPRHCEACISRSKQSRVDAWIASFVFLAVIVLFASFSLPSFSHVQDFAEIKKVIAQTLDAIDATKSEEEDKYRTINRDLIHEGTRGAIDFTDEVFADFVHDTIEHCVRQKAGATTRLFWQAFLAHMFKESTFKNSVDRRYFKGLMQMGRPAALDVVTELRKGARSPLKVVDPQIRPNLDLDANDWWYPPDNIRYGALYYLLSYHRMQTGYAGLVEEEQLRRFAFVIYNAGLGNVNEGITNAFPRAQRSTVTKLTREILQSIAERTAQDLTGDKKTRKIEEVKEYTPKIYYYQHVLKGTLGANKKYNLAPFDDGKYTRTELMTSNYNFKYYVQTHFFNE